MIDDAFLMHTSAYFLCLVFISTTVSKMGFSEEEIADFKEKFELFDIMGEGVSACVYIYQQQREQHQGAAASLCSDMMRPFHSQALHRVDA